MQGNGYIERNHKCFDEKFAVDRGLLMQFLMQTQPDEMATLTKIYKDKLEETLVNYINSEATKDKGSLLSILKHGIELSNIKLTLFYPRPATSLNKQAVIRYQKNIFSVMKEVWASEK